MNRRNVNRGYGIDLKPEGILDFLLTSIDQRIGDRGIPPFHEWVKNVILDGKPFTYEHHEYLIEPYRDDHPHQVEEKAAQMGLTSKAMLKVAYGARYGGYRGILYLFPSKSDVTDFSKGRIEVSRRLSVTCVYADLDSKHDEMISLFNEVSRYHHGGSISLSQAPLPDIYQVSLKLITEWIPSIVLSEGKLKTELSQFSQDHQEDPKSEYQFNAIRALTFILASFELGPLELPTFSPISSGGGTRIRGIV